VHEYQARVTGIVDGDTVDLEVDLGFRVWVRDRFRLHGYNAPESRGPERALGSTARLALVNKLRDANTVTVQTHKRPDKYGRWLCRIWVGERDIIQELIGEGYGRFYDGGRREPFDPSEPYPL
jgi:micrococcal nuclease